MATVHSDQFKEASFSLARPFFFLLFVSPGVGRFDHGTATQIESGRKGGGVHVTARPSMPRLFAGFWKDDPRRERRREGFRTAEV
jgi:hypothetical protein